MRTPISYYGGKQRMLRHILPLIPKHDIYVEPFCGGAAVFWGKSKAGIEVLNDMNGELVNFFQVARSQPEELGRMINATPHSRKLWEFSYQVYQFPEFHDPVRRAWAVWHQANFSFANSICNSWAFNKTPRSGSDVGGGKLDNRRKNWSSESYLEALVDRLRHVQLECRDACYVIQQRDHADAFHYVDPPYINTDQAHYNGYTEADYERLLSVLSTLKGRFMLSCFPGEMIDRYIEQYGWQIKTFEQDKKAAKTKGGERSKKKVECLIMNYTPENLSDQELSLEFQT